MIAFVKPIVFNLLFTPVLLFSQGISGVISIVQDGDSFQLETPDSVYRIRLYGIDCPEINQTFGGEAKEFLSQYFGDSVIIIQKDIDKYGRTLADVFYHDTLLNLLLLQNGLAWHYKKYSSDSTLTKAELAARSKHLGLWANPAAIAPWNWREGNIDHSVLEQEKTKVFICINSDDRFYHNVHYCSLLSNCENTIALVFPDEATDVYHKEKCPKCFNQNTQ